MLKLPPLRSIEGVGCWLEPPRLSHHRPLSHLQSLPHVVLSPPYVFPPHQLPQRKSPSPETYAEFEQHLTIKPKPKTKAPPPAPGTKKTVIKACAPCQRQHTSCDQNRPCRRCCHRGRKDACIDLPSRRNPKPKPPMMLGVQETRRASLGVPFPVEAPNAPQSRKSSRASSDDQDRNSKNRWPTLEETREVQQFSIPTSSQVPQFSTRTTSVEHSDQNEATTRISSTARRRYDPVHDL